MRAEVLGAEALGPVGGVVACAEGASVKEVCAKIKPKTRLMTGFFATLLGGFIDFISGGNLSQWFEDAMK